MRSVLSQAGAPGACELSAAARPFLWGCRAAVAWGGLVHCGRGAGYEKLLRPSCPAGGPQGEAASILRPPGLRDAVAIWWSHFVLVQTSLKLKSHTRIRRT